jgi:hypothetical protein
VSPFWNYRRVVFIACLPSRLQVPFSLKTECCTIRIYPCLNLKCHPSHLSLCNTYIYTTVHNVISVTQLIHLDNYVKPLYCYRHQPYFVFGLFGSPSSTYSIKTPYLISVHPLLHSLGVDHLPLALNDIAQGAVPFGLMLCSDDQSHFDDVLVEEEVDFICGTYYVDESKFVLVYATSAALMFDYPGDGSVQKISWRTRS